MALAMLLSLLPAWSAAESALGTRSATARVHLRVVVPPVFRILQVRQEGDAVEYRVWTNMRSVFLNGREFRFSRVGESVLRMPRPARPGIWIVPAL